MRRVLPSLCVFLPANGTSEKGGMTGSVIDSEWTCASYRLPAPLTMLRGSRLSDQTEHRIYQGEM
jgi:hypothetical protein